MIQVKTSLQIIDNSGGKTAKCLKVLGGYKKKIANLGDLVIVSIQKTRLKNNQKKQLKIKKKQIFKAIVIRTKMIFLKKSGFKLKLKNNAIILLDYQNNPLGTRVLGIIPQNLRKKFYKFVFISFSF